MALSDAVAAQILGELHVLTKNIEDQAKRVEKLATTVVAAAKAVDARRTILHSQNEALLIQRVNEITQAIGELKGMEGAMQLAARAQADVVLSPIVNAVKTGEAIKYFSIARDVYKTLSEKLISSLVILGLFSAVAIGGSFYAGVKFGTSSAEKTESHSNSRPFSNQK